MAGKRDGEDRQGLVDVGPVVGQHVDDGDPAVLGHNRGIVAGHERKRWLIRSRSGRN